MIVHQPEGYEFKHAQRIHLDSYRGVGKDFMSLDDRIADGFMRTSDMRGDVVITQKPRERVHDYDQLGHVRVAKFLRMPRIDFWNGDNVTETRKDGDGHWNIAINDQELADKTARAGTGKNDFDERFVTAFRSEVKRGLRSCLQREKILNGGNYNYGFLIGYHTVVAYNLLAFPTIAAAKIAVGDNPIEAFAVAGGLTAVINAANNTLVLGGAGLNHFRGRILGSQSALLPDFNDPFVKHSVPEMIMPPVPVDRLIRGIRYLNSHGENMIAQVPR